MGQNGQGPSLSSADLSKKRKRGRPRKDENLVRINSMSAASASSVGPIPTNNGHTEILGQVVSGYIDGIFDGGYLITVKVGGTYLRGLAFLPGRVVPITAENDVAPHSKMIRRQEVFSPALDSQSKQSSSLLQTEKKNEQPGCILLLNSQSRNDNSTLPSEERNKQTAIPSSITLDQVTPAQPISSVTVATGNQSAAYKVPSTDNSQKSDSGRSLENLFFSEYTPGTGFEDRDPTMSHMKLDKFCEQNKVSHDFGDLNATGGPDVCIEKTEDSKKAGLRASIEPTLDLGQQSQFPSSVHLNNDGNSVVQDKVRQNSEALTLVKGADTILGLKGVSEPGASDSSCADFLGKFPKSGSPLKVEGVMNDGVGKPDLQLNKATNHDELEKASDIPSKFVGPITDINAPSEIITEERPSDPTSDPSVDIGTDKTITDKTKSPDENLPNEVAEFNQATSYPACMQAIPAESTDLQAVGSIFTEANEKQPSSSALKPNLLAMTSDMETIPSEPRLAAEPSCLTNAIETSVGGSSSATK